MTPTDKKINRKVAAKVTHGLIMATVAAGFGYYGQSGTFLQDTLDGFGTFMTVAAACTSLYEAWKLFRTPKAIRYLLAIREEFGKPDEPVKLRNGDRVPTGPTEIIN